MSVSSTASRSKAERLITLSISAVAVCCSSVGELARALLLGLEQTYVFDGDHGLVGESGHQLDLLVGERQRLLAGQNNDADDPRRRSGTPSIAR